MYVHKPWPDQVIAPFLCGFPWSRCLQWEALPLGLGCCPWDWALSPPAPHLWKNDCFYLEWSLAHCGLRELNFWEPLGGRPSGCALWAILLVRGVTSPTGDTKPITCQMSLPVSYRLSEGGTCEKLLSCTLLPVTPQNVMGVASYSMPLLLDSFHCWV